MTVFNLSIHAGDSVSFFAVFILPLRDNQTVAAGIRCFYHLGLPRDIFELPVSHLQTRLGCPVGWSFLFVALQ